LLFLQCSTGIRICVFTQLRTTLRTAVHIRGTRQSKQREVTCVFRRIRQRQS